MTQLITKFSMKLHCSKHQLLTKEHLHRREYLEYLSNNDNLKFQDKLMSINVNVSLGFLWNTDIN